MNETAFRQSLIDASTVISVLLAFLTVLFGLKFERVRETLNEELPPVYRPDDRASFRKRQSRAFLREVLPVGVPSLVLTLVVSPAFFHIAVAYRLAYPNLDLVVTLFVAVALSFAVLTMWSVTAAIRLGLRARK